MPEYEYRCKQCEQVFAIERSMSDSSPAQCTNCHSNDLARIWGVNFLSGNTAKAGTKTGAIAQGEAYATNPAKPKSCCPCG